MDELTNYIIKKNPSDFFIINNIVILRFSRRTDILDLITGNLLDSINVKHLSQVVLCTRYNTLYLKSVTGPVYSYHLETRELNKICSTGNSHEGIFLSIDQEHLIAFTEVGETWDIETKSGKKKNFYKSKETCFHRYGWDDPNDNCYKFLFFPQPIRAITIASISYSGEFLYNELITVDGNDVLLRDLTYDSHNNKYIFQYTYPITAQDIDFEDFDLFQDIQSLDDLLNMNYEDDEQTEVYDNYLAIGIAGLKKQRMIMTDSYEGGNPCSCVYTSILFVTIGNRKIHVVDLDSYIIKKEIHVDSTIHSMQYDSSRNVLFVGGEKIYVIYDVL